MKFRGHLSSGYVLADRQTEGSQVKQHFNTDLGAVRMPLNEEA